MNRTKLELILFGVLLQRPQTGYDLNAFMEKAGRFMRTNTSMTQVYRSLRTMEERGWLTHTVEPRPGAQDAKRYRVTEEGCTTFMEWLREPYRPPEAPGGPEFFTHLRFRGAYLGLHAVLDVLDVEITFRRRQIARNRHRDRTEWVDTAVPFDDGLASALMDWEHHRGAHRMDVHLEACIELRDRLASGEVPRDDCPPPLRRIEDFTEQDLEVLLTRTAR